MGLQFNGSNIPLITVKMQVQVLLNPNKNFLKYNYPDRPGITNIREKGDNMHIATFLGEDCPGANFINSSGGTYLVDEFIWP